MPFFPYSPKRLSAEMGFRKHDTHSGYNIWDFYLQSCFQAAAATVSFSLVCPLSSHCCSNSALFLFQVPVCYWNRGGMIRRWLPAKLANPSPAAELHNTPHHTLIRSPDLRQSNGQNRATVGTFSGEIHFPRLAIQYFMISGSFLTIYLYPLCLIQFISV